MLKVRIIPCLDVKDGRTVKGVNFVDLVDAGDPVEQAKIYEKQGADELCFLDITASSDGRDTLYDMVRKVAEVCFIPFTVGGGVRSSEDIRKLLLCGADKVAINTAAINNPNLIAQSAERFGGQCIVVSLDVRRNNNDFSNGNDADAGDDSSSEGGAGSRFELYTHGGRKPTGIDAVEFARKVEKLGAGEILLTSMDRDGTKAGYDNELVSIISDAVKIPVVASGGVGELQHFVDGAKAGGDALLAASVFHFGTFGIDEVKNYMKQRNISVRM